MKLLRSIDIRAQSEWRRLKVRLIMCDKVKFGYPPQVITRSVSTGSIVLGNSYISDRGVGKVVEARWHRRDATRRAPGNKHGLDLIDELLNWRKSKNLTGGLYQNCGK